MFIAEPSTVLFFFVTSPTLNLAFLRCKVPFHVSSLSVCAGRARAMGEDRWTERNRVEKGS